MTYEEPPPYSSVVSHTNNDGIINHSFYIGEQPTSQMSGDIPNIGQQIESVYIPNSGQQTETVYKPEIHI